MSEIMWWGYLHTNGHVQVKRYFDPQDLVEAYSSPFVKQVFEPFEAVDRDVAVQHCEKILKRWA